MRSLTLRILLSILLPVALLFACVLLALWVPLPDPFPPPFSDARNLMAAIGVGVVGLRRSVRRELIPHRRLDRLEMWDIIVVR